VKQNSSIRSYGPETPAGPQGREIAEKLRRLQEIIKNLPEEERKKLRAMSPEERIRFVARKLRERNAEQKQLKPKAKPPVRERKGKAQPHPQQPKPKPQRPPIAQRQLTLEPGRAPAQVWDEIRAHSSEREILLAGHEPLLGYLTGFLLGAPSLLIDLKKGSLVRIDMDHVGLRPRGVLRWYLTPKLAISCRE